MDNSITLPKHIQANLDYLWGTKDCRVYLLGLLNTSRDTPRQGFPPHIAKYLWQQLKTHDELYPHHIPPPRPWDP